MCWEGLGAAKMSLVMRRREEDMRTQWTVPSLQYTR